MQMSDYEHANTQELHYEKHHQAYVNKLNKLIEGTVFENELHLSLIRVQLQRIL